MDLVEVKQVGDIIEGDTLIITGDTLVNEPIKVQMVKVSETDGVEVIFDKRNNRFFNLGMYLQGKSWVKQLKKIV